MQGLQLSDQQKQFFDTFGYLAMPGLMADCIDDITAAFEEVWEKRGWAGQHGQVHDGSQRTMLIPFIDQHPRLCALLEEPRIEGLVGSLIGRNFNYAGSDGNYYVGNTGWHSDRWVRDFLFVKVAFYLDPVGRDSGCLRVIPGSHRIDDQFGDQIQEGVGDSAQRWGVEGSQVPALSLETVPGDVVIFIHNLKHASFGGGTRRMFTINCCQRASRENLHMLKQCISDHAKYGLDRMYSDIMVETAGPARRVHLQQVLDNQGHMAEVRAAPD